MFLGCLSCLLLSCLLATGIDTNQLWSDDHAFDPLGLDGWTSNMTIYGDVYIYHGWFAKAESNTSWFRTFDCGQTSNLSISFVIIYGCNTEYFSDGFSLQIQDLATNTTVLDGKYEKTNVYNIIGEDDDITDNANCGEGSDIFEGENYNLSVTDITKFKLSLQSQVDWYTDEYVGITNIKILCSVTQPKWKNVNLHPNYYTVNAIINFPAATDKCMLSDLSWGVRGPTEWAKSKCTDTHKLTHSLYPSAQCNNSEVHSQFFLNSDDTSNDWKCQMNATNDISYAKISIDCQENYFDSLNTFIYIALGVCTETKTQDYYYKLFCNPNNNTLEFVFYDEKGCGSADFTYATIWDVDVCYEFDTIMTQNSSLYGEFKECRIEKTRNNSDGNTTDLEQYRLIAWIIIAITAVITAAFISLVYLYHRNVPETSDGANYISIALFFLGVMDISTNLLFFAELVLLESSLALYAGIFSIGPHLASICIGLAFIVKWRQQRWKPHCMEWIHKFDKFLISLYVLSGFFGATRVCTSFAFHIPIFGFQLSNKEKERIYTIHVFNDVLLGSFPSLIIQLSFMSASNYQSDLIAISIIAMIFSFISICIGVFVMASKCCEVLYTVCNPALKDDAFKTVYQLVSIRSKSNELDASKNKHLLYSHKLLSDAFARTLQIGDFQCETHFIQSITQGLKCRMKITPQLEDDSLTSCLHLLRDRNTGIHELLVQEIAKAYGLKKLEDVHVFVKNQNKNDINMAMKIHTHMGVELQETPQGPWKCNDCTFENYAELNHCEICDSSRVRIGDDGIVFADDDGGAAGAVNGNKKVQIVYDLIDDNVVNAGNVDNSAPQVFVEFIDASNDVIDVNAKKGDDDDDDGVHDDNEELSLTIEISEHNLDKKEIKGIWATDDHEIGDELDGENGMDIDNDKDVDDVNPFTSMQPHNSDSGDGPETNVFDEIDNIIDVLVDENDENDGNDGNDEIDGNDDDGKMDVDIEHETEKGDDIDANDGNAGNDDNGQNDKNDEIENEVVKDGYVLPTQQKIINTDDILSEDFDALPEPDVFT